jgi:hypothetical protein
MRSLAVILLLLAGCSTMRGAAGAQRDFAEKGVGINTAAATEAQAPADAAPAKKHGKDAPLPTGLGGDAAHAIYAPVPPKG